MKKRTFLLLFALLCAPAVRAQLRHADLDLNGPWEYGIDRDYTGTTTVPGIPADATRPTDGRLWYRREIRLPEGCWNTAVLELKGARFRPEVYVDGRRVSSQEGGMIRSLHELRHEALRPGSRIVLEISLASLADTPASDASYIPKVDQWRSNCSSSLWDDAVLHLYTDASIDRLLTDCDPATGRAALRYRIRGRGAAAVRIAVTDGDRELLTLSGGALPGDNEIAFDYRGVLREWSPEHPHLYGLRAELLDEDCAAPRSQGSSSG